MAEKVEKDLLNKRSIAQKPTDQTIYDETDLTNGKLLLDWGGVHLDFKCSIVCPTLSRLLGKIKVNPIQV